MACSQNLLDAVKTLYTVSIAGQLYHGHVPGVGLGTATAISLLCLDNLDPMRIFNDVSCSVYYILNFFLLLPVNQKRWRALQPDSMQSLMVEAFRLASVSDLMIFYFNCPVIELPHGREVFSISSDFIKAGDSYFSIHDLQTCRRKMIIISESPLKAVMKDDADLLILDAFMNRPVVQMSAILHSFEFALYDYYVQVEKFSKISIAAEKSFKVVRSQALLAATFAKKELATCILLNQSPISHHFLLNYCLAYYFYFWQRRDVILPRLFITVPELNNRHSQFAAFFESLVCGYPG